MKQPVTVIGLGNMGSALASAFLAAGHPTTVWNRSSGKDEALVKAGAVEATSANAAATAAELVVGCVVDYAATRAALAPAAESLSGRTVVSLNTGASTGARQTAGWVTAHGARYLDGAIMAVPQAIGQPETLIIYSGSQSAFDEHGDTLRALGGDGDYVGDDPGAAVLFEAAIGATLQPALWGFVLGAAVLRTVDIKAETLLPYADKWLNNVIAPVLPSIAREIDSGDYTTDIATIKLFATGIRHEIEGLQEMGIDTDVLEAFQRLLERAMADGRGEQSFAGLFELIRSSH